MDKNYYIEAYNKRWNECLEEVKRENVKDIGEAATIYFEDICNAEEVVGYYLVCHGEDALKDWRSNIDGTELTIQDLEVDRILTELFK